MTTTRRWAMKREANIRQATKTAKWKWKLFKCFLHCAAHFCSSLFTISIQFFFIKSIWSVVVGYFGRMLLFFVNMLPWHIRSEFQMKMKKFTWNLKRNKNLFSLSRILSDFYFCTLHFCLSIHTFHYGNSFDVFICFTFFYLISFFWVSSWNLMKLKSGNFWIFFFKN